MKRAAWIVALVIGALVGGGIAYASIPSPSGVINGCYKTSGSQRDLIVIDSTESCPSGYAPLNWNQTGSQGPAGQDGVSGLETVRLLEDVTVTESPTAIEKTVSCPSGKKATGGGGQADGGSQGSADDPLILQSYPVFTGEDEIPTGWLARFRFAGSVPQSVQVEVRVICITAS